MSKALINPANITWARERAGMTVNALAERLKIKDERLLDWESGDNEPTMTQARKIADCTLISFGLLFAKNIPEEKLPIPDLRTLEGKAMKKPSASLIKIIRTIMERQDWYRDYHLENLYSPAKFKTEFNADSSIELIVNDIRAKLSLPNKRAGRWDAFERLVRQHIEDLGILVMKEPNLGSPNKPLLVEEFRGFAIYDEITPVIFVNGADAPTAQLFTLIHELAHIWIGQSGLSDASHHNHRKEEVLCNAVAAEFLVPQDEFIPLWPDHNDWRNEIKSLANYFHVSGWVIVRRALTLELISENEYHQVIQKYKADHDKKKSDSGPSYYTTLVSRRSKNFSKAVVSEALSGRVLLRDAGHLLGIKPLNIKNLATELGI